MENATALIDTSNKYEGQGYIVNFAVKVCKIELDTLSSLLFLILVHID